MVPTNGPARPTRRWRWPSSSASCSARPARPTSRGSVRRPATSAMVAAGLKVAQQLDTEAAATTTGNAATTTSAATGRRRPPRPPTAGATTTTATTGADLLGRLVLAAGPRPRPRARGADRVSPTPVPTSCPWPSSAPSWWWSVRSRGGAPAPTAGPDVTVPIDPRAGRRRALTPPGRAAFEWAVLFAAVALVFPLSGLVGVGFAHRARRRGYARWPGAVAAAVWCGALGAILQGASPSRAGAMTAVEQTSPPTAPLPRTSPEPAGAPPIRRPWRATQRECLVRRQQGARAGLALDGAGRGDGADRAVRMRQVDLPADPEPDARADPRSPSCRARWRSTGSTSTVRRCG